MLRFFSAIDVSDQRGREHRVFLPSRAETFAEDFNETNVVAPTGPARNLHNSSTRFRCTLIIDLLALPPGISGSTGVP